MISRALHLSKLLGQNHSAFLLGARGTGKTYLATKFLAERESQGAQTLHIDLLSLRQQARYLENPGLFRADIDYQLGRSESAVVVLVDEVQKAPQLLDEAHHFLESARDRCQFLLTGSSARKLKRGGANLLGGRALSLFLHPLSVLDMPLALERTLQFGSLPRFYLDHDGTDRLLDSYVETYLKEEIQAERVVRRLPAFHRFLNMAAQMNGKLVNYSSIAREIRISDQTVRDYYEILTDTLLAFELPAWSRSVRQQLSHAPRYYFFDCGVLNAILGDQSLEVRAGTNRYGYLFENFVIGEFFRQNDYLETRRKFYAWRTSSGTYEVDIVIDQGLDRAPIAIEVKSSSVVQESDFKGLRAFQGEFPTAELFCICKAPNSYMLDNVTILPWETGVTEILKATR